MTSLDDVARMTSLDDVDARILRWLALSGSILEQLRGARLACLCVGLCLRQRIFSSLAASRR